MKPNRTPSHQLLQATLTKHLRRAEKSLSRQHPHAVTFFEKHGIANLRHHAAKVAASGALAGAMLFGQPVMAAIAPPVSHQAKPISSEQLGEYIIQKLKTVLPATVEPLSTEQEKEVSTVVKETLGINAYAVLGGERLNHSYGLIGAEQHLPRYPGDSLDQHDQPLREGITPGLGAWGYFASSKQTMTRDLIEKEKWYVAVQTLYVPDWNARFSRLRDWYMYRKVVVINTINGKTVIADIADAGPAKWTGKHFGGSPEVMQYLQLNVGMQKGPVVVLFVDDPLNEIPLGPVEQNVMIGGVR